MLGIDTNLLVYAFREDLPEHLVSLRFIESRLSTKAPTCVAWPSVYEFFRIVTHKSVFKNPSSRKEAIAFLEALQSADRLVFLSHGPGHFQSMIELCDESKAVGNLAFDVQIAAIFKDYGVTEVATNDADFLRFRSFKILNPMDE